MGNEASAGLDAGGWRTGRVDGSGDSLSLARRPSPMPRQNHTHAKTLIVDLDYGRRQTAAHICNAGHSSCQHRSSSKSDSLPPPPPAIGTSTCPGSTEHGHVSRSDCVASVDCRDTRGLGSGSVPPRQPQSLSLIGAPPRSTVDVSASAKDSETCRPRQTAPRPRPRRTRSPTSRTSRWATPWARG